MKIQSFEFDDPRRNGWKLSKLQLHDGINLFVGATGAGKSRVLNMISNISLFVSGQRQFCDGKWTMCLSHKGTDYTWRYAGFVDVEGKAEVTFEELRIGKPEDKTDAVALFARAQNKFSFKGKDIPKLAVGSPGIYLLREEEEIAPIFDAFSKVLRRNFYDRDLNHAVALQPTPASLIRRLDKKKDLQTLFGQDLTLSVRLYILQRYFPKLLLAIREQFQRVFPHVEDFIITMGSETYELPVAGDIPVLHTRERGVDASIPIQEMSTGMQKVLLIVTDVITGPKELLYMIDEYENSLGVNAIDFLPAFLNECGDGRQFLITSHHPHLINAVPVSDWYVFHRSGTEISVLFGPELVERYGKSKQQKFTQLLNDPFYAEGVE